MILHLHYIQNIQNAFSWDSFQKTWVRGGRKTFEESVVIIVFKSLWFAFKKKKKKELKKNTSLEAALVHKKYK